MSSGTRKNKNILFDVSPLKIHVDISVPGSTPFILTSAHIMYSGSKTLGLYPMFTDSEAYPYSFLIRQPYDKVVEFFFIKNSFMSKMTRLTERATTQKNTKTRKIRKSKKMKPMVSQKGGKRSTAEIGEDNFKTMLSLLFPISYPISNNIHDSYSIVVNQTIFEESKESESGEQKTDEIESKEPDEPENTNFFETIRNVYNNSKNLLVTQNTQSVSYIKYENQDYTVSEIIWLNDFLNYPVYMDLLEKYDVYLEKKSESINYTKINDEIIALFEKLKVTNNGVLITVINQPTNVSSEYINSVMVNDLFTTITKTNDNEKNIKLGETLINAYSQIKNPNINYQTRANLSKLKQLYDTRQLNIILENFEKTFDTKYIKPEEQTAVSKYAPYVFELGQVIQTVKKRLLSNKTIQGILEKPSEDLDTFIDFVESYKHGEGGLTEHTPDEMKILFDKVVDSSGSSKNELFIEVYILMNVIKNKYDLNTISDIKCHFQDSELAVLKKRLYAADNNWNMKLRKHYFSDKEYIDEIQIRNKKIMTPVPTTAQLEQNINNLPIQPNKNK